MSPKTITAVQNQHISRSLCRMASRHFDGAASRAAVTAWGDEPLSFERPPPGVRDYDARRSPGVAAVPHRLRARKPINDQSSQRVDLEPVRQQDRFHEPAGVACKQSKSTALFGGQSHRLDRLMLKRQRSRKKTDLWGCIG